MQLFSLSGWLVAINVHASCLSLVFIWLQFTTGVPPERQKVMVGGVTLQNDEWGKAKAKIKEVCQHYIAYLDLGKQLVTIVCARAMLIVILYISSFNIMGMNPVL